MTQDQQDKSAQAHPGSSLEDVPLPRELGDEPSEQEDVELLRARHTALATRLSASPAPTAMVAKPGLLLRWLTRLLFARVLFERRCVDMIEDTARRGRVVYVMRQRSRLDYLYYNAAFVTHGLPLARQSNGPAMLWFSAPWAWLKALWRRGPQAPVEEQVEALVASGQPALLFLESPGQDSDEELELSQRYMYRLMRLQQRQPGEAIYLVPLSLFWARRPDPRHVSFLHDVFGTPQRPGFFRKVVEVFQTTWQSFFNLGQPMAQVSGPLSLRELMREYPDAGAADLCELASARLLEEFEREQHVLLGPTGEPPEEVFRELAQRPEIAQAVQALASETGESEAKLRRKVRAYFDEIAAAQSLFVLKLFSLVLGLVFYRIYDGFEVDEAGLARVREAGKTSCLILMPSHKSHIDYLILSYLFYQYGLMPPHIAAGVNLSFFPLGALFRRAGAFFIRRSFKGETLYPLVFREYLIHLMRQSYPIEFFIEGTRSRTGKLIKPRTGMLEMIVRARAAGRVDAVSVVPISVGYERIIEERAYSRELLGEEKRREGLAELLKAPRVLTSRYGRLYVQFAEPISVDDYLDQYAIDRARLDTPQMDALIARLGHRIIYDINRVSAVTPTALAATVLLNNTARHVDRQRLCQEAGFLLRFLRRPSASARLSRTLAVALEGLSEQAAELELGEAAWPALEEALGLFEGAQQVAWRKDGEDRLWRVPDEARMELSIYRNTLVHLFVPEALLAAAALKLQTTQLAHDALREETRFLSRLFKYEWIYEERARFETVFRRTLAGFERAGWVQLAGDGAEPTITITSAGRGALAFLRRMVLPFLEAYAIMAAQLEDCVDTERERGALLSAAMTQGRGDFMRGRILFYESLSKPTFTNALRLFTDWGAVQERRDASRKKEQVLYQVSATWREGQEHVALRQHLEALVYQEEALSAPTLGG